MEHQINCSITQLLDYPMKATILQTECVIEQLSHFQIFKFADKDDHKSIPSKNK